MSTDAMNLASRRALLAAALGFNAIQYAEPIPPAAHTLATWLDNWRGVGAVVGGMRRLGFDVEMKQMGEHWRVNFRMRARRRERVGVDAVARGAAGGAAGAARGSLMKLIYGTWGF